MSETKQCNRCGLIKPVSAFELLNKRTQNRRTICYRCRLGRAPAPHPAQKEIKPPKVFLRTVSKASRYLITAAQNATAVHAKFLSTLQRAAERLNAELVIVPLRYKNPTRLGENADDDWWDPAVVPFLFDGRVHLNKNLCLVADVKNQPTAVRPLSGFQGMTGAESCIIGHPKMELVTVPTGSNRYPKIMVTTGAVTDRNYSDTRAGKLGEFHHFLGGLIVEIDAADVFHIRQINASRSDGSFIDLNTLYTPKGAKQAPPALGLVLGDSHARFTDPAVDAATFGPGGIVETLNPETLVFHDVIDGYACNPHHKGNAFIGIAKQRAKLGSVHDELCHVVDFVNQRAKGRKAVIVDSNHHDFLPRYVKDTDWRQDPANAEFYLETALAMARSVRMTAGGAEYEDPFRFWVKKMGISTDVHLLEVNESFKLNDIECGLHGHRGPNGARGNLKNLSRMGTKTITGHSHTPGIEEGGYAVGTSTPLRLEYNQGPSSWLNTHCVVYANGKRSLINIIKGAWRLPPATGL